MWWNSILVSGPHKGCTSMLKAAPPPKIPKHCLEGCHIRVLVCDREIGCTLQHHDRLDSNLILDLRILSQPIGLSGVDDKHDEGEDGCRCGCHCPRLKINGQCHARLCPRFIARFTAEGFQRGLPEWSWNSPTTRRGVCCTAAPIRPIPPQCETRALPGLRQCA